MLWPLYIILGIFLALAFYHLLVFLGRLKDQSNIAYTLLCLCFAFVVYTRRIYTNIENHSVYLENILSVVSIQFIAWATNFFPYTVFDLKRMKKLYVIFAVTTGILSFFVILLYGFFKYSFTTKLPYFYSAIYAVVLLFTLIIDVLLKKQYQENNKKRIIFIGFMFLISSFIILGILTAAQVKYAPWIAYTPFLLMCLIIAIALTDSFNSEHQDLLEKEEANRKLEEAKNQLEIMNCKLKDKDTLKTLFFINLAHETRTPLTLISNYFDEYEKKTGSTKETVIIKNNIEKLKKDMESFLEVQKIQKGRMKYDHDLIVNFSKELENSVILFQELAKKDNINIIYEIKPDLYIKSDPIALRRIINNLIDNAVKYSNLDGTVTISLSEYKNKIVFTITDNGIGMTNNQLNNIFLPYNQVSNHENKNKVGMGIGLTIVKQIIDELEGYIKVDSKLYKGSTFTISLNKYEMKENDIDSTIIDPPSKTTNIELLVEDYSSSKKTVFIVDDNKEMIVYLQTTLCNDYNVFYALNGIEALKKIQTLPAIPDIIISDVMMDKLNGYDFFNNLRGLDKYSIIPFLFLTAKKSENERIDFLNLGVVDFIYKPFNILELKAKIKTIISIKDTLYYIFEKKFSDFLRNGDNEIERKINNNILTSFKDKTDSNIRKTILIVDDNKASLIATRRIIPQGIDIYQAFSVEEAISKLKEIPTPNLILSDVIMPVMDGYAFLEYLKQHEKYKNILFAFVSAIEISEEDRLRGLEVGVIDYFVKPFRKREFQARITNLLTISDHKNEIKDKEELKLDNVQEGKEIIKDLTEEELTLVTHIVKGLTFDQIAEKMYFEASTIRNKASNLYKKLGVKGKTHLKQIIKENNISL